MRPGPVGGGWAPGEAVVTPEAVELDLVTGGIGSRGLARALDLVITVAGLGAVLLVVALIGSGAALEVAVSFLSFLAVFGYPAVFEWLMGGRTPGKAALGLRVVTVDGAPIGPRQAVIRSLLGPVDVVAGVESMLFSARDRRLGDLVAGTVVLRERSGPAEVSARGPLWFGPPSGCESFTASLPTDRMTAVDQAVVRSYVQRWHQFTPAARHDLAVRLATPIAVRLRHRVPYGMPPDLYLWCLAAARQLRDSRPPRADAGPPPPNRHGWGPPASGSLAPGITPPT